MQLLVQNCLDPTRATEIFSVPKRRIFALPKIVCYRNKSGLQSYSPFNFSFHKLCLISKNQFFIRLPQMFRKDSLCHLLIPNWAVPVIMLAWVNFFRVLVVCIYILCIFLEKKECVTKLNNVRYYTRLKKGARMSRAGYGSVDAYGKTRIDVPVELHVQAVGRPIPFWGTC